MNIALDILIDVGVIDTNVALGMFSAGHPYHSIFLPFAANRFANQA